MTDSPLKGKRGNSLHKNDSLGVATMFHSERALNPDHHRQTSKQMDASFHCALLDSARKNGVVRMLKPPLAAMASTLTKFDPNLCKSLIMVTKIICKANFGKSTQMPIYTAAHFMTKEHLKKHVAAKDICYDITLTYSRVETTSAQYHSIIGCKLLIVDWRLFSLTL